MRHSIELSNGAEVKEVNVVAEGSEDVKEARKEALKTLLEQVLNKVVLGGHVALAVMVPYTWAVTTGGAL